jgi:hypothetical protein
VESLASVLIVLRKANKLMLGGLGAAAVTMAAAAAATDTVAVEADTAQDMVQEQPTYSFIFRKEYSKAHPKFRMGFFCSVCKWGYYHTREVKI